MDATTNIKLCNGHSRTHIRYGMEGDHITNYLPFTECKFGLKAHMEHPTTQTWKNVTCKCSARVRPKSDPCKRTLHHAIPYHTPNNIITAARVQLRTARASDTMEQFN